MNENNDEPMSGAVDQQAFEKAIRENLSPEGVATIIAFLQPAAHHRPSDPRAMRALREVEWFTNTLTDLIGVQECTRLFDELSL